MFEGQKDILIFGFAKEGVSTLNFLRNHGVTGKIFVSDHKPVEKLADYAQEILKTDKNLEFINSSELENNPKLNFSQIFLTPGTPINRLPNRLWRIVMGQTTIFLQKFASQTIGVTGTKGKGTTSSLIYEILKADGKDVVLLGNIGVPALDYYDKIGKNTIVVYELSSHQLTLAKNSPHIAVFLNIFPEHLDYYGNFDSYLAAKTKVTQFQQKTDDLVINLAQPELAQVAESSKAIVHPIVQPLPAWPTQLLGEFNQQNIAAAWEVARLFKVPESVAKEAVRNFKPLEHRLEPVGTFKNLTFFNDSFATVPESTILALNTFGDQLETLITGGFDRGIKYTQLSKAIENSPIKNLIVFPTTGGKILEDISDLSKFKVSKVASMEEAVKNAYKITSPGKVVLMSCASPSFNLFKDFKDRGVQFKDWVVKLGKSSGKEV